MQEVSEKKEGVANQKEASRGVSREPLFGTLLFVAMILFVISLLVGLGWAGYLAWRMHTEDAKKPSIVALKEEQPAAKEQEKPKEVPKEEKKEETVPVATEKTEAKKDTAISVLNGGAAKGSAGTLVDTLKQSGYSKVSSGNTVADYTGVVIYYAVNLEKEAAALKEALIQKYASAEIKPAITTNKETTVAPLTVILGK